MTINTDTNIYADTSTYDGLKQGYNYRKNRYTNITNHPSYNMTSDYVYDGIEQPDANPDTDAIESMSMPQSLPPNVQSLLQQAQSIQDDYDSTLQDYNAKMNDYVAYKAKLNDELTKYVTDKRGTNYFVNTPINGNSVNTSYKGCYLSGSPKVVSDASSTFVQCMTYALNTGAQLFGLNDKSQCVVYPSLGNMGKLAQEPVCTNGIGGNTSVAVYEVPTAEYYGTYGDTPTRAMKPAVDTNKNYNFTFDSCLKAAQDANAQMFGLQDYSKGLSQCFISNDLETATQYGEKSDAIKGSDGNMYGGPWENAIYILSSTPKYLGCYNLPTSIGPKNDKTITNIQTCQQYAIQNKYKYFACSNSTSNTFTFYVSNSVDDLTSGGINLCTQSNPKSQMSWIANPNSSASAIYSIDNMSDASLNLVSQAGYLDLSNNIHPYSNPKFIFSDKPNYTTFNGITTSKTTNLPTTTGTLEQCNTACDSSTDCYGYEFNSTTGSCTQLGQGLVSYLPTTFTSADNYLYVKNPSALANPMFANEPNLNLIDSVGYAKFNISNQSVENPQTIAENILSQMEAQVTDLSNNLLSKQQQLSSIIQQINQQVEQNQNTYDINLKKYNNVKQQINAQQSSNKAINNIIGDIVLRRNYSTYVFIIYFIIAIIGIAIIFRLSM